MSAYVHENGSTPQGRHKCRSREGGTSVAAVRDVERTSVAAVREAQVSLP